MMLTNVAVDIFNQLTVSCLTPLGVTALEVNAAFVFFELIKVISGV